MLKKYLHLFSHLQFYFPYLLVTVMSVFRRRKPPKKWESASISETQWKALTHQIRMIG
jgi:hypothetical protein